MGFSEPGHLNPKDASCVLVFLMKQESPDRSGCRVHNYLDYWNYELLMRAVDEAFRTDWIKIGPALAEAAAEIVKSVSPPDTPFARGYINTKFLY